MPFSGLKKEQFLKVKYINLSTMIVQEHTGRYGTDSVADPRQRKTSIRTMNFEKYAADGNRFINQVADELDIGRNSAARITRAVLHAVRDRLPPNDAIEFAQGLPMALKGIFIDQYDLSRAPLPIRHPEDFIDYVCYKDGRSAAHDFPYRTFVEGSIAAVFKVLERTMDYGQVAQIKKMMNDELGYLFE